jgi:LDH2 family malate/lactate/ureidoglycolate dehydrogenase
VETINGAETMKIRQSLAMPMDMMIGKDGKPTDDPTVAVMSMTGNMRSSGIINILEDNARIVRSNADLDGDIQMNIKEQEDNPGPEINLKETGNVMMYLLGSEKSNPAAKKK